MDEAFQTLEKKYLAPKRYPQFFDAEAHNMGKMMKLFEAGACYPLIERDDEGRRIVLLQSIKWDTEIFSVHDAMRLLSYVNTVLLEEEETQIAGVVFVFDFAGANLKQIMSPMDARDFMDCMKKCQTGRLKGTYFMNLPSFANVLMELFMQLLSEKLRKRVVVLKSSDELKNYINPSWLPQEYGGTKSEAEMRQAFIKFRDEKQEKLLQFFDYRVDWNKVPHDKIWSKEDEEAIGSFRKLEVD